MQELIKKHYIKIIGALAIVALVIGLYHPTQAQAATISQVTTWTTTVNGQTVNVPAGLSNVCIVYMSVINDADHVHTDNDRAPTFGGTSMTNANPSGGLTQVSNGGYVIDAWYLKNYTSTGSQALSYGNHGGFGTYQAAVYIISGCDTTTQLDATTVTGTGTATNPSLSLTTTVANGILIDALGDSVTAATANSQTVDATSGTNMYISSKVAASATSQTVGWTAASGSYAHELLAVRSTAATPAAGGSQGPNPGVVMMMGSDF